MIKNEQYIYSFIFAALGIVFYIPFLGGVHLFDWDEINFAEISREMLVLKDFLRIHINYESFWEKPPLFFWLQSLAMSAFGINEFAARFPNAICGVLTLVIIFNIGKTLFNTQFGVLWALAYFGSVLPFLYFKSGIIDPWFNLFIFSGLYFFIRFYWKQDAFQNIASSKNKWTYLSLSGVFIGLGILTKGPVAYLIPVLCMGVYWIIKRFKFYISPVHFILFTLISAILFLGWCALEIYNDGFTFIKEFIKYQIELFSTPAAGHAGFTGYHVVVLLVGVFPASIFCIRTFFKSPSNEHAFQDNFIIWMKILFWVVLILFSLVQSKIVHYSSLCYFPMTFLAAHSMHQIMNGSIKFNQWLRFGLISIGGVFIIATIAVPVFGQHIEMLKPLFQKDPFALANLEADINWSMYDTIPGIFLLMVIIITFIFLKKQDFQRSFYSLYFGTAFFVMLTLIFDINHFESYSQRAAIEFYKSKANEDCYIITYGFKSYGHLFYAQKRKVTNVESYKNEWLMDGPADKPVYAVAKITKASDLKNHPLFQELYRKNGFVFFQRTDIR